MSELIKSACPFCGSKDIRFMGYPGMYSNSHCECKDCHTIGPAVFVDNEKAATEAWNRRTQPEATKPAQDLGAAKRIDLGHGSYIEFERKTSGASGWLLRNEGGNLVRALSATEVLLVDAALASPADALVAGDRVDVERTGTLYQAVQRAAGELPEGWTICLEIERDAGTVELIDPEGNRKLIDGNDGYLCQAVNEATNAAIQAQKDGHG